MRKMLTIWEAARLVGVTPKTALQVRGFFRSTTPVGTIHAAADEPEKLVRELWLRLHEVPAPDGPPLVTS